jgi:hypothetical protein
MRKNNFRFILTRNRRFVANGVVDIGEPSTGVSVNVTDDTALRSVAATVLLMVVYNIIEDDGDRMVVESLLNERGASAISSISSKLVTPEQALADTADDIPF